MYAALLPQAGNGVLYLQLATLELDQLKIVNGGVLAHFRQFRLQHLMSLFKFRKFERGHMANLLVSDCPAMPVCHVLGDKSTAFRCAPHQFARASCAWSPKLEKISCKGDTVAGCAADCRA
jgi:hypothetical protein